MPRDNDRVLGLWAATMFAGDVLQDMWDAVRRLAPEDVIALLPIALGRASETFAGDQPLEEQRRRLLVALLVLHRTVFDLMGTERSPDASLISDVVSRFFS